MMKLNLLMFPATLLLLLTVQTSVQAPGVVMPKVVPRQRIHACGRELIHIVTFSCGASRWKRASMQDEMETPVLGSANTEVVQTDSNKVLKTVKLQSAQDPEQKQPHINYQRNREAYMDAKKLEEKCCQEGCDYEEIKANFC